MAVKKKPNPDASEANASNEAPPSTTDALITTNNDNNEDQDEDIEVEDLTEGEFEVGLHDLGITTEDIQALNRINARLVERLRHAQQAQAGTSNAPVSTRSKGKGHELTAEEVEEQLNKLKEEELRCKAMRQTIRDRLVMMKHPRQAPKPVQQAPQPQRLLQNPFSLRKTCTQMKRKASTLCHISNSRNKASPCLSRQSSKSSRASTLNPTILSAPQIPTPSAPHQA